MGFTHLIANNRAKAICTVIRIAIGTNYRWCLHIIIYRISVQICGCFDLIIWYGGGCRWCCCCDRCAGCVDVRLLQTVKEQDL